ncbi:MAG: flagellar basal body P-ring formation chaperone FlgA [Ignavibacteriaceae bacterium]
MLTFFSKPNESLKKTIGDYLKDNLKQYDKYEYTIVKVPTFEGKYEIRNDTKINLSNSFAYIPIKITRTNSNVIQTYITVRLKLFKTICVAKDVIEPGQALSNNDVEFKLVNVTDLRGTPIESPDKLNGLRSKVKINPGSILIRELLDEIPVINKGDRITASAIAGNVKISTDAEAKQDGVAGDIIYIVTKDKKQFKAKIIDSNNVIIIE